MRSLLENRVEFPKKGLQMPLTELVMAGSHKHAHCGWPIPLYMPEISISVSIC